MTKENIILRTSVIHGRRKRRRSIRRREQEDAEYIGDVEK